MQLPEIIGAREVQGQVTSKLKQQQTLAHTHLPLRVSVNLWESLPVTDIRGRASTDLTAFILLGVIFVKVSFYFLLLLGFMLKI